MRKVVIFGGFFTVFFLLITPCIYAIEYHYLEQIQQSTPPKNTTNLLSAKNYLFGRIDRWYWYNTSVFIDGIEYPMSWQIINGSNFREIGIDKYTYSDSYKFGVFRKGWGYGFSNFEFQGILTQRYIFGVFYIDDDIVLNKKGSIDISPRFFPHGPLFFYRSVHLFNGTIDHLEVNGDNYSFTGVDLIMRQYWRIGRSWGIGIDHVKNDELSYYMMNSIFIGKIKPDYISGIFIFNPFKFVLRTNNTSFYPFYY